MRKALLAVSVLIIASPAAWAIDVPPVRATVVNQNQAVGNTFAASNAVLSGTITPFVAGGRGLDYLTVRVDGKLQGGTFIVPPDLAAQLRGMMNPGINYNVNFIYGWQNVPVNGFAPAYGVVTRVDFVDGNGRVFASVAAKR
jgi:hypothetical protein